MSASEFKGCSLSGIANEALTEFRFVDFGGTTAVEALKFSIADTGDAPMGIVSDTVASGDDCAVYIDGYGKLTVDGSGTAIAAGDYLKPDASSTGKGIKAATNLDSYGARALEPATTDGAIINVIIERGERSIV